MAGKVCPMLTTKMVNPITCRHDCAWYVEIKPDAEFDEPQGGCAFKMVVQELHLDGSAVTGALEKLRSSAAGP